MITRQKIEGGTVVLALMLWVTLGGTARAQNPFTQHIKVFDLDVYATTSTPADKVVHAAGVFAQYLDNDEDGVPDNQLVYDELVAAGGFVAMKATEDEYGDDWYLVVETYIPNEATRRWAELYGEETNPDAIVDGVVVGPFDYAWEEILHLITDSGYAEAYPSVFGWWPGTDLANAMDIARGGHFENPVIPPGGYPEEAWYHYDDYTCDYGCMNTEYIYWALTSILGAQAYPGRPEWIFNEWELSTKELVESTDTTIYALLTDPQYKFPTILPDGHYDPNSVSH
jgi:hypothetical protein